MTVESSPFVPRRQRAKPSTLRSRDFPASTRISFASSGETTWAGLLPPIFRDGCSCACSPIGSKPRHSGISTGRFCDVCTSTGTKPSSSRDARPFATRGPTTREGVGLKSGALLVREWNGRLERVMILDDGCAWNGCVYRSLSQVAKAITGTNWNGHRFFGLKAVRTGASNKKRNVTPRPDSLLDIGVSPTLAGFAPAMPDRSPPLATKESEFGIPEQIGLAIQLRGRRTSWTA